MIKHSKIIFRKTNLFRFGYSFIVGGVGMFIIKYDPNTTVKTKWITLSSDIAVFIVLIIALIVLPDLPKYIAAYKGNKIDKTNN